MKLLVSIIITALLSISAYACNSCAAHTSNISTETVVASTHEHDHAGHQKMMDNIVKFDSKGQHTALCGCGMEVTVNTTTLTATMGDTKFYVCGQGCADGISGASDKDKMEMMKMWKEGASKYVLASNAVAEDGKQIAKCGCGMDVTVGEHTTSTIENGVQLYFCGSGCQDMVSNMSEIDRSALQSKFTQSN